MSSIAALNWVSYLHIAASALLIVSILRNQLFKAYPFFLAYLLADEVQQLAQKFYSHDFVRILKVYMAGDFMKLILITFTVRGVLRIAFESYPSLAEFLKRTGGYLAAASAFVALLLTRLDPSRPWTIDYLLPHFFTFERTVYSTLLGYLLLVGAFMAWFPVRIRRNVAIFIGGFAAFFASHWVELLLLNRTQRTAAWLGLVTLIVSLGCVVCWTVAIRPKDDETMTVTGLRWNPETLGKLTRQLESINTSLGRFVRTSRK